MLRSPLLAAALLFVLAGCSMNSSGSSTALPAATAAAKKASGASNITFHVPAKNARAVASRGKRKRSYVSPSTSKVAISINSIVQNYQISEESPYCTAEPDGALDCTVSFTLPDGNDNIQVLTYDQNGAVLSEGSTSVDVTFDDLPDVDIDLLAVVDHASILPSNVIFSEQLSGASPQQSQLSIIADDADNNQIDGDFYAPITIASRNPRATSISLSGTQFTSSSDLITVTYAGGTESTGFVFDGIGATNAITPGEILLDCKGINQGGDYKYSTKMEVQGEFDPSNTNPCQIDGPGGSPNETGPNGGCSVRIVRGQCPNVYDTYTNYWGDGNYWGPMTYSSGPYDSYTLSESYTPAGGPQCIRAYAGPLAGSGFSMAWEAAPPPHSLGEANTNGRILFVNYVYPSQETVQGLQARPQHCVN